MVSYNDIVKRLVQYRQSHHITQRDLAEIFSITQGEVSKLEATEYRISYYDLIQLQTKTDLDIDFLITGISVTETIFHTLEKELNTSSISSKYIYTDLILFCLNRILCQMPTSINNVNQSKNLQRLLRYSYLSGSKQKTDCWTNIRSAFDLTQIQMSEIIDVDIKRYRNIEKCKKTANAELLMNVYNSLGIFPSYFKWTY